MKECEMLKDFAKYCDENGIVYYLMYGTLIGAARHGGFIPWDDDIDVVMDLKNYRKFLKCAKKNYPEKYFVQNFRTDRNVWINWTKIRMNGTTSMECNRTDFDIHYGICMDIFPVVGKPKKKIISKLAQKAFRLQNILLGKYYVKTAGIQAEKKVRILHGIIPEILRTPICTLLEKIMYVNTERCELCYIIDNEASFSYSFNSKAFTGVSNERLIFEGEMYRVPNGWKDVLTAQYGDWRTPPPYTERGGHGDIIVDLENDYKTYYTGK